MEKEQKEKLSSDLRGLVGENSLSERTWNDYIDNSVIPFIPTEDDKRQDYLSKHANAIKSLSGQLNNEVAGKVNEFKKTYKPEPTSPQPLEPLVPNPEPIKEEIPTWAKSMFDKFDKIEQDKTNEAKAAKLKQKLSGAREAIQNEGADNDTILNITFGLLKVEENESAEDVIKKAKELYNKTYTDVYGSGYNPASGSYNSAPNNQLTAEAKKVREKMEKERESMKV